MTRFKQPSVSRTVLSRAQERRRLFYALLVTGSILVIEFIGGLLSGSLALLADAGHMFVDLIALLLSSIAIRLAERPVQGNYTFGFRRAEVLVALFNGITLLIICASIAYEAVSRLMHPEPIHLPLMIAVAGIGTGANIVSALLLRDAKSLNVRSAFLHVLGDLFSSVSIIVAGMAMLFWDAPWLDPSLSMVIAIVVLISAYRLTTEAFSVLMEAAPKTLEPDLLRQTLQELPFVMDVHDLHVWTITSRMISLSCHVVLQPGVTMSSDAAIRTLSQVLRDRFDIEHTTIQIESSNFQTADNSCDPC